MDQTKSSHCSWLTVDESNYGGSSLTQARFLDDGALATKHRWLNNETKFIITTASEGSMQLWSTYITRIFEAEPALRASLSLLSSFTIHQSCIRALDLINFSHSDLEETSFLAATGGDDNAVALTVFQLKRKQRLRDAGDQGYQATADVARSKMRIVRAHTASVVALRLIQLNRNVVAGDDSQTIMITAGAEQVLKSWRVTVSRSLNNERGVKIEKIARISTLVSDVSALECSEQTTQYDHGSRVLVIVCGSGYEMIWLDVESGSFHRKA